MDERREQPAEPVTRAPVVASAGSRLSPVQEAYSEWATHRLGCVACRDIDLTCGESDRLHRAWRRQTDDAFRQLDGETA